MFTLILPALLRPDAEHLPEPDTPFLDKLLRFARFEPQPSPLGRLYAEHLAVDFALPEHCVYASPVWQQMGMHSMNLLDGAAVGINEEEAEALCSGLNEFYRGQARFRALRPDLWRMLLPASVDWQAPPVFDVLGQIDGSVRAEGTGAAQWLQMQTEIQMWLHDHPMNRHRRNHQQPPINGIWLWNAPVYPSAAAESAPALMGCDSPWTAQSPLNLAPAPARFQDWQQYCDDEGVAVGNTAVWLDGLTLSRQTNDTWAYGDVLAQWDETFFQPLWEALSEKRMDSARIITDGEAGGTLWLQKPPLFAWFKAKRHFNGRSLL